MKNVKIFTELIEEKARVQVYEIAKLFPKEKIRIMPDVHVGIGSVIGFTCELKHDSKIIPNIVGVDIGCGVHAYNIGNIDIEYSKLDNFIRENIPHGFKVNNEIQEHFNVEQLKCYDKLKKIERLRLSVGSLGGGNHFIEIDESKDGNKWLVIHSGSRNLGHQIAMYYQNLAFSNLKEYRKSLMDSIIKTVPPQEREAKLKTIPKEELNKQTAYLLGDDRSNYLNDMYLATEFARVNRNNIAKRISEFLNVDIIDEILSVHNYISENGYIRKGAISAGYNERVLIPINMRDGVILGTGKGNPDWNYSAPHGAGRLMGRKDAKRRLNMDEFVNSMKGIYTTSVNESTLDEAPMVYKPIESIISNIKDTVEVIEILKPLYNFKSN